LREEHGDQQLTGEERHRARRLDLLHAAAASGLTIERIGERLDALREQSRLIDEQEEGLRQTCCALEEQAKRDAKNARDRERRRSMTPEQRERDRERARQRRTAKAVGAS
jgi:hypothetical protein